MIDLLPVAAAVAVIGRTPPSPPPPFEAVMAATRLLERHPPSEADLDRALAKAIETIANGTVWSGYRGEWGGPRWREFRTRFVAEAAAMVAPYRSALVDEARGRVAQTWARGRSGASFEAIEQSKQTATDHSRVWTAAMQFWEGCFYWPARKRIDFDTALVASGPPRQSEPPLNR